MGNTIISVEHISKEFQLGVIGSTTLKRELQSKLAVLRGREDPNRKVEGPDRLAGDGARFLALDDINFSVREGDALGVIGRNGAGKSTLLKLISRVTAPTAGAIRIRGRVASLLEVGTGFHPELTGRENVFLNGSILGMTKAETARKMDEIVEFSEIERFIDTPVKRYSSGMYVKLGFSVAAHLDPDILICDEVLAVGDTTFQHKCIAKMADVAQQGSAVLCVSHNMRTMQQLCTRAIYLDRGRLTYDGDVDPAISLYAGDGELGNLAYDLSARQRRNGEGVGARLQKLQLTDTLDCRYELDSMAQTQITWTAEETIEDAELWAVYKTDVGEIVGRCVSQPKLRAQKGETIVTKAAFNLAGLAPGVYQVRLLLVKPNLTTGLHKFYDAVEDAFRFNIMGDGNMRDGVWQPRFWGNMRLGDIEIRQ
ncbi:MAG: polysaccharide ABC transporter ATP-binding protein [Eubacteriales bacterium]|nr:polysaccharide ABC transporter ATP-binding protein [Eubacteriales bacterium]